MYSTGPAKERVPERARGKAPTRSASGEPLPPATAAYSDCGMPRPRRSGSRGGPGGARAHDLRSRAFTVGNEIQSRRPLAPGSPTVTPDRETRTRGAAGRARAVEHDPRPLGRARRRRRRESSARGPQCVGPGEGCLGTSLQPTANCTTFIRSATARRRPGPLLRRGQAGPQAVTQPVSEFAKLRSRMVLPSQWKGPIHHFRYLKRYPGEAKLRPGINLFDPDGEAMRT